MKWSDTLQGLLNKWRPRRLENSEPLITSRASVSSKSTDYQSFNDAETDREQSIYDGDSLWDRVPVSVLDEVEQRAVAMDERLRGRQIETEGGTFALGELSAALEDIESAQSTTASGHRVDEAAKLQMHVSFGQEPDTSAATYAARSRERERLEKAGYKVGGGRNVNGTFLSEFESEHLFSFSTTNPPPFDRRSAEGKLALDRGLSYLEYGDVHRSHVSSYKFADPGRTLGRPSETPWSGPGTFRNHVRMALRGGVSPGVSENLSVAGQMHLMDYAFVHGQRNVEGASNGAYPSRSVREAADNSFQHMLRNADAVEYTVEDGNGGQAIVSQKLDNVTRAELLLARYVAVSSKHPTKAETNQVLKAVLTDKEYDEKTALRTEGAKSARHSGGLYESRSRSRDETSKFSR